MKQKQITISRSFYGDNYKYLDGKVLVPFCSGLVQKALNLPPTADKITLVAQKTKPKTGTYAEIHASNDYNSPYYREEDGDRHIFYSSADDLIDRTAEALGVKVFYVKVKSWKKEAE